ncbi:MAG: NADH-quinone oxidoreductase subunit N [Blastocatellia bacterium AA13]|nr:MAG: NADH-quinone oxidoreductase subunit N [Blastocatellia bacterium AA13]
MDTSSLGISYHAILPELITATAAIAIMVGDAVARKISRRTAGLLALAGCAGAAVAVFSLWGETGPAFYGGMIINDPLRLSFAIVFLAVSTLTVLISIRWIEDEGLPAGEYFALLMFATTGMLLMASANDLVMIFLGLEITSISTYVLCGYRRQDIRSNESAVKYFILGSFSTAFLLYGIALIYGACYISGAHPAATTNLQLIRERIADGALFSPRMLMAGAAMMIVGFGFKVATAPFHIWSPDVYQGAPTPVTAFLSTGSKAAAFASFSRVFILTFAAASVMGSPELRELQSAWTGVLAVMAILTMTIGNLVAIVQTNIKRMLAYSSIAHAGYALMGIVARDWQAVAFYMIGYAVINIGAFAVIEAIARRGDIRTSLSDYSGIGFRSLGLASVLSLFLLSLAGIPATAGFVGKLLVFKSAWGAGFHMLVVIAVINSAVSWYYYLRVIVLMFFSEPAAEFNPPSLTKSLGVALVIMAIATFYLGLLPGRALALLENAKNQATMIVAK